jgi:hypothetical protein
MAAPFIHALNGPAMMPRLTRACIEHIKKEKNMKF